MSKLKMIYLSLTLSILSYFCIMDRIEQLKNFLSQSPDDCFLKHALALEYGKIDDLENAHKCFEENLHFDETYLPTYYHLGQLLERMDREEEALKIYAKGMEIAHKAQDQHAYSELRSVHDELLY